jgi:hypothetical protein
MPPDPRSIFIIHGRNHKARDALSTFLQSADLRPIPWESAVAEAARRADDANPFIAQVLEAGLEMAQAVVVLLTGDDVARLKRFYETEKLTPQARPNVLLEAGMALGRFPRRTVLVQIGTIRGISDIAGRHIIRLDHSDGASGLRELLDRLEDAGCTVDRKLIPFSHFGPQLVEGEPEGHRWRQYTVYAALLILGMLLGIGGSRLLPSPEVKFKGSVRITGEPVTAYLAIDQHRKLQSGDIELRVGPSPRYVVLYEAQKKIIDDVSLKPGEQLPTLNVDEAFLSSGSECGPQPRVQPNILIADDQAGGFR